MKGTNFASYIRKKTGTNSTTFTDADMVLLANIVKDDLVERIVEKVDEDYFLMDLLRDLVADQRVYTFPNDIAKEMKHLQAKLDGSEWSYLTETDLRYLDIPTEETNIRDHWTGKDPEFDIRGRGVKLLTGDAIIAVTEGLKLIAQVYPEDISASTLASATDMSVPSSATEHAMPRAVHGVWADLVVIEYKNSKQKPIPLTVKEKNIDLEIGLAMNKLKRRNKDRSVVGTTPYDVGQDY